MDRSLVEELYARGAGLGQGARPCGGTIEVVLIETQRRWLRARPEAGIAGHTER